MLPSEFRPASNGEPHYLGNNFFAVSIPFLEAETLQRDALRHDLRGRVGLQF
jgi:hypothetical protein